MRVLYNFEKKNELKREFQFKIDVFAISSVFGLHRQMNILLELNKLYFKLGYESLELK